MELNLFIGSWSRVAGSKGLETVEINEDLELLVPNRDPVKLRVDEKTGGLADAHRGVTYWQRSDETLLVSLYIGEGEGTPWTAWGGELIHSTADPSGPILTFHPKIAPADFLRGFWHVRTSEGNLGGRAGNYVMFVASGDPDKESTRFWLCYSKEPAGPWIRYDVMTFNPQTGSLDSVEHHRTVSMLEARRPDCRAIYAMFYELPPEKQMPFEASLCAALGDDGTGAWGAEDG